MVAEHFIENARRNEAERDEPDTPVKVVPVDKYEVSTAPPPPIPAPPPPPPTRRRSFHSVPQKEKFEKHANEDEFNENRSPPTSAAAAAAATTTTSTSFSAI
ncbi:formin-like protein 20 [Abeliophyllum distichum]|uniref:Formin-like protein 20 n=1 Tax=Abeliophyllum distichum TaxID=126358 RepID=A0ABD1SVB4_9LAMI